MDERSNIEQQAKDFVEENRLLLDGGEPVAINRVFTLGARISVALSAEAVEAANEATEATEKVTKAVRNRSTPAVELNRLEKKRKKLTEIAARKRQWFEEFDDFMKEVEAARQ